MFAILYAASAGGASRTNSTIQPHHRSRSGIHSRPSGMVFVDFLISSGYSSCASGYARRVRCSGGTPFVPGWSAETSASFRSTPIMCVCVRAGFTPVAVLSSKVVRPTRSRLAADACDTTAATPARRVSSELPGGPSRTPSLVSRNSTHRTGTSFSYSLVMSLSFFADTFHAIIFGGSPGR